MPDDSAQKRAEAAYRERHRADLAAKARERRERERQERLLLMVLDGEEPPKRGRPRKTPVSG